MQNRASFELFKSETCHVLKNLGDIHFIIDVLENDEIRRYYNKKWYPEAFYLLAMVDYISRINNIPQCKEYNDIRSCRLESVLFPTGILLEAGLLQNESIKEQAIKDSIPEFIRHNIVEREVRNVI